MLDCQTSRTPVDTGSKLSADGDPFSDPSLYRSLTGALQYLTLTRPEISFAVQQACLYMHDPRIPHYNHVKRILRYLKGTLDLGLHINKSSPTSLTAYSLMQTGLVVQILVGPHPNFVFFLVTIWFLGLQKGRLRSPARLLKLSTALWLMRLLIQFGCASCCRSCTVLLSKLPLFTVKYFSCLHVRKSGSTPSHQVY